MKLINSSLLSLYWKACSVGQDHIHRETSPVEGDQFESVNQMPRHGSADDRATIVVRSQLSTLALDTLEPRQHALRRVTNAENHVTTLGPLSGLSIGPTRYRRSIWMGVQPVRETSSSHSSGFIE